MTVGIIQQTALVVLLPLLKNAAGAACSSGQCMHGGTCNNDSTCVCVPGYVGDLCEDGLEPRADLNNCSDTVPCLWKGICARDGIYRYCECVNAFVGHLCQYRLVFNLDGADEFGTPIDTPTFHLEGTVSHISLSYEQALFHYARSISFTLYSMSGSSHRQRARVIPCQEGALAADGRCHQHAVFITRAENGNIWQFEVVRNGRSYWSRYRIIQVKFKARYVSLFLITPAVTHVEDGTIVRLVCTTDLSNPLLPEIRWKHNNVTVYHDNIHGTYSIRRQILDGVYNAQYRLSQLRFVAMEGRYGVYHCQAQQTPTVMSGVIRFTQKYKPTTSTPYIETTTTTITTTKESKTTSTSTSTTTTPIASTLPQNTPTSSPSSSSSSSTTGTVDHLSGVEKQQATGNTTQSRVPVIVGSLLFLFLSAIVLLVGSLMYHHHRISSEIRINPQYLDSPVTRMSMASIISPGNVQLAEKPKIQKPQVV